VQRHVHHCLICWGVNGLTRGADIIDAPLLTDAVE
jgi:hypothetical protein